MVTKSAIMIFLEVFWKQFLQNEEEIGGIRMPLDGSSACRSWLVFVASHGRASRTAAHYDWSRRIQASASSTRYSFLLALLPLRES